ncbi:MAG TPA: MCE family protein [Streptosporangiaceae bacterium]|jgi:phospholipid/cholesterol/gamma-HCH transport system substrate-binding protein
MRGRAAAGVAAAAALAVTMAGCGGIYSLPLPGGASLGSHPYQVTAQFANVLDLVPQSAVRVNDVAVGRVTKIYLPPGSWTARVVMQVNGRVKLPANAIAQIQQSSLLGEQYVALEAPPGVPGTGRLGNGALIPPFRTTSNATVEQVLGALSLLLNGGGISQLHTIVTQLNAALAGNEPQIRALLPQLSHLLNNLYAHRKDIENALDGLNRLSATLAKRDHEISYALANLSPGLRVLARQHTELVQMLTSLRKLTGVAVDTIHASQASLVADLQALAPTLQELARAGQSLPLALQVLLTYPFTNQVLNDVKGGYLNTYLSVTAHKGTKIYPPVKPPRKKGGH